MTDNTYQPAKVWTWDKSAGGAFANINRPVSGPTEFLVRRMKKRCRWANIHCNFIRWERRTVRK